MDRQKKAANLVKNSKNNKKHSKISKIIALSVTILIISALCLFFNVLNPLIVKSLERDFAIVTSRDNLLVHFVNVGQGDSIAINLPDGKLAVIDVGPINSTNILIDYLNDRVLNHKHDKKIDYLILTHADADHIGGATKIISTFDIANVFMPTIPADTATYLNLCAAVEEKQCNVFNYSNPLDVGTNYSLKSFDVLDFTDTNNSCPVIKLEFMSKTFLFTGDLEAKAEKKYVELYGDELDVDVLKVAHHGSKYSSCEEFLEQVTPQYSVISSGNKYGHPNEETLDRLNNVNSQIVRTDTVGNVMFAVGKNYDLDLLTGDYTVSGFIFDYRIIVLIIDGVLIINIVVIAIKKKKE
mgnify:FL=1